MPLKGQPMSPELKQKIAEGRAKAALARQQAENLIPKDLPPGHERDEARRIVADHLEERRETENEALGIESIDASKLNKPVDNEIARHVTLQGPQAGTIEIKNAQKGYRYALLPASDGFGMAARANIRTMHTEARRVGWEPVSGDMPEATDLRGNDCCSGTTLRGVGDTVLYRISEYRAQQLEERDRERQARQGAVEERSVMFAQSRGIGTMHEMNDRYAAQRFSPEQRSQLVFTSQGGRQTVTSQFTEGDIRRGSIPGMPAPGSRR